MARNRRPRTGPDWSADMAGMLVSFNFIWGYRRACLT